jgi:ligand-binding sensor domain-containing protein/serine phosphatase RsbU (regulator of sigma subunit)
MQKRILIFSVFLSLFQGVLFSQQYYFRKYSVEEGLPQSSVHCLLQDSRGYIWIGTDGGGVARFDGQKFETFSKTDGLSGNVVRSLLEDSKGNIWIGTDNGLTFYNGFKFKTIGRKEGLKGTSVMKIIEGSNGTIWIATSDSGLARLTGRDSISIMNYNRDDGLVSNFIFDIYEDDEKRLWLGMVGGVNIVEFEDESLKKIKNINRQYIAPGSVVNVISIEPDHKGIIWLGTHGDGLFAAKLSSDRKGFSIEPSTVNSKYPGMEIWDIFNNKNGELWLATNKYGIIKLRDEKIVGIFNKENGLLSNEILEILEDREGNMWFASFGKGAIMYDDEKFLSYNEKNGINGSQVQDILFTDDNILYLATEEGLLKLKREGNSIRKLNLYTAKNGLNDVGVNAIEQFKPGQIWIGTNNGINILNGTSLEQFSQNNGLDNKRINSLLADSYKNMWIGTSGGLYKLSGDKLFLFNQDNGLINDEISTVFEDKKGRIWVGTFGGLVSFDSKTLTRHDSVTISDFDAVEGLTTLQVSSLAEDPSGNIWIGTLGGGLFKYENGKDSLPIAVTATKGILSSNTINSLLFISDTLLIAGNDKGFDLLILDKNQRIKKGIYYDNTDGFSGGESNPDAIVKDNEGYIWFGTKNGLLKYDPAIDFSNHYLPEVNITGIRLFFQKVDWALRGLKIKKWSDLPENLILSHKDNHLTFDFTGICYHNPDDLEFSYYLENLSKEWSPFSHIREVVFSSLVPGNYTFKIKARNKFGLTGNTSEYHFVINPPFWETPWFYIPAFILFVFIIITIIRIRERSLRNEKIKLEKIVDERTHEVVEQKNEIERQRDVVTYQKKEITDSIHYAERIQQAVLPDEQILKNTFSDYFIIFRPKDIVSGDFYWMTEKDNHVVFAAADCTGHGVPGALMSMLGVSFLNKIVNESGIVKPSSILTSLRENIITALKQEDTISTAKDGMDIALCSVDIKNMKLWFSGANNPLYLIRKENDRYVLIEKKGDRMPIGYYSVMSDFTNHELDLQRGDKIYLFSDGFIDQFGGPEKKKFMIPRFKQMLLDNQELNMSSQKGIYIKTLEDWINGTSGETPIYEQIDDIILVGIEI